MMTERQIIKNKVEEAKVNNINESPDSGFVLKVRGDSKNCKEGTEAIHSTTASVKQSVIKYHEGINENLINTRNLDRAPVHNNVEGFNQEFVNNCLQENSGTSNLVKSWIGGISNPFSIDYSKRGTAKCQK